MIFIIFDFRRGIFKSLVTTKSDAVCKTAELYPYLCVDVLYSHIEIDVGIFHRCYCFIAFEKTVEKVGLN